MVKPGTTDAVPQPIPLEQVYRLVEEYQRVGRLEKAEALIRQILDAHPNEAQAIHSLGLIFYQRDQITQAFEHVKRSVELAPNVALYHANLAEMFRRTGMAELAIKHGELAIALQPDHPDALNNLGIAYYMQGSHELAIASYKRAIAQNPNFSKAFNNLGNALRDLGRFAEAGAAYSRSLELDPAVAEVHFSYAHSVKFTPDDPHLKTMESLSSKVALSDRDRLHIDFALAKAYADLGNHTCSFKHLLRGNALKRAQIRYDEIADSVLFDRIKATFTADLIREKEKLLGGNFSPAPVFIVGMPRSGTSLVEQILASHPHVYGGGELTILGKLVNDLRSPTGKFKPFPEIVPDLDCHALEQIGTSYLAEIRKLAPDALRVTDKRPFNFYFSGLIHLILPSARIIHTTRDPLDTCVSCFSKLFVAGQNDYSYNLAELGRYYRRYQRLMEHWRQVMPLGCILEVRYEDLVTDLEGQARRMVEYCGLAWDPRCLSFYRTERAITTASAMQVRQPIYNSAVGRARAYDAFLAPLKSALSKG